MEQNQEFDKYAKAKIEEPNLRLPKALLRVNTDQSGGELFYIKLFEDDTEKVQHLADAIAAGVQLDRKVYRIRNKDLFKAAGEDFKHIHDIHKVSKATIGVLSDDESDQHFHSFIDLVGTVDQVKLAEKLIIDQVLKNYTIPMFPVILMPPIVYGHKMKFHVDKIGLLMNSSTVVAMEVVSGAWVQVHVHNCPPSPGGNKQEIIVSIFGPKGHVIKAASLLHLRIYEPGEPEYVEVEKEVKRLFDGLSFDEMKEGMKPRTCEITDLLCKLTEGKQKLLQVGEGSSGSGSGSGPTEEQKQLKDDQRSEDESKAELDQHEVDVEKS